MIKTDEQKQEEQLRALARKYGVRLRKRGGLFYCYGLWDEKKPNNEVGLTLDEMIEFVHKFIGE